MRKPTSIHRPEARVAELAKRDHGVLTTHELLASGLTHAGIHRRAKTGRLHRLHHGVYAVGHAALSREGQWLAARVLSREQWEATVDRARARGFDTGEVVDEAPTRSVLERILLRLCRRHRIPLPEVNVRVGPFLVDFLWRESRLIVEVATTIRQLLRA